MPVSGCGRDQGLILPPCGVQLLAQGREAAEAAMHGHCPREPAFDTHCCDLLGVLMMGLFFICSMLAVPQAVTDGN